jgi:hypothetical protein
MTEHKPMTKWPYRTKGGLVMGHGNPLTKLDIDYGQTFKVRTIAFNIFLTVD